MPAILYRTNCLLIAEEIRVWIAEEAQIGIAQLPDGFRSDPRDDITCSPVTSGV